MSEPRTKPQIKSMRIYLRILKDFPSNLVRSATVAVRKYKEPNAVLENADRMYLDDPGGRPVYDFLEYIPVLSRRGEFETGDYLRQWVVERLSTLVKKMAARIHSKLDPTPYIDAEKIKIEGEIAEATKPREPSAYRLPDRIKRPFTREINVSLTAAARNNRTPRQMETVAGDIVRLYRDQGIETPEAVLAKAADDAIVSRYHYPTDIDLFKNERQTEIEKLVAGAAQSLGQEPSVQELYGAVARVLFGIISMGKEWDAARFLRARQEAERQIASRPPTVAETAKCPRCGGPSKAARTICETCEERAERRATPSIPDDFRRSSGRSFNVPTGGPANIGDYASSKRRRP